MKKTVFIPAFHSLKDPILDGLLLVYLKALADPSVEFHLTTLEQEKFQLTGDDFLQEKTMLEEYNIFWKPIQYRSGGMFILFKKVWNYLLTLLYAIKINRQSRLTLVLGFTSLSGAMAYLTSFIIRKPLAIYCFEPHSLYMLDFKVWKRKSLNFLILNWFEKKQVQQATSIVVPNHYGEKLVRDWGRKGEVFKVPVSVKESEFKFDPSCRDYLRDKMNVNSRFVFLYLGKFSGIYYSVEEIAMFYKAILDLMPNAFFQVISPNDREQIESAFVKAGLDESDFHISGVVGLSEISGFISAADIGVLAVPPLPSQVYRTPIKTANYLLCGLPYVTNRGVADDDLVAKQYKIGVVINDLTQESAESCVAQIENLMKDPIDKLRERCRKVAVDLRGVKNTTRVLTQIIQSS